MFEYTFPYNTLLTLVCWRRLIRDSKIGRVLIFRFDAVRTAFDLVRTRSYTLTPCLACSRLIA